MTLGKLKSKKADAPTPEGKTPKKLPKIKVGTIIKSVLVLAVIAVGGYYGYTHMTGGNAEVEATYTDETVERRTIIQSLSSSGTLAAANSYTVTTLVEGEILWSDVEEGVIVEADDLLFEIDNSDVSSTLEKAEISYAQALRSYDDTISSQYVTTDYNGEIYEMLVDVGDYVSNGDTIAYVRDNRTMELKVPFPTDDVDTFYVGQAATITLSGTFETITGTVTKISNSSTILTGNRIVRNVTISVTNNGGLSDSHEATATVGGVGSTSSDYLTYASTGTITSDAAGEVVSISADEGDFVYKDNRIATLGGDDMEEKLTSAEESLRTTELTYESSQDALDNYTFTSPIAGTLIEKNYKAGDNVESGDSLCIIYDLSYLEMTMSIDELDIKSVAVGQTVDIVADSNDAVTFEGTVTKVSVAGTTSGGTTTYPVTVRITEFDDLLPGMNVSAEIVLEEVVDVISVSSSVVQRGNTVLVTADSPSAVNAIADMEAPEGYVYVAVETGLSDDDYVQIVSGLEYGDTVASMVVAVVAAADTGMMMPGMEASSGMTSGPGTTTGMSTGGMSSGGPGR